ncbi:RfaG Glycosyltransferase [uncultured Caudovirales phage]|uniref:RfaG Glycosyltransferase n=1 Tax=uncultured Caudovirales phage TaxID=2100421 RepID=A0A6J5RHP4_9CAUD|nr:RfaG Glycosyltransferase [uncultured Caudovirales phage]
MKICWMGFCARNHSWSIVAQNISRELIALGHKVDLFSTNGISNFPEDLRPNLKGYIEENYPITHINYDELITNKLEKSYDMQLSYTALKNFEHYFIRGNKNRFGIWNYETTILPKAFAKYYKYVDKVLPSSNFSKKIFTDNGMPEDHQAMIPHGIHLDRFSNLGKYPLKTKKKYKILCNIAQPHLRKNIPGMLDSFGKAFSKEDDVCLVLKISKKSANNSNASFDVNFNKIYNDWNKKFKNHGEVEIIDTFITDIETIYNACDIVFTMANTECFWMPGLEGFAANKIVVAPRYGGQLDYMNDNNSILIDGKIIRADNRMQYWEPSPYAACFEPDINQCALKLKDVISNYDDYMNKFSPNMKELLPNYTWRSVAERILLLCK